MQRFLFHQNQQGELPQVDNAEVKITSISVYGDTEVQMIIVSSDKTKCPLEASVELYRKEDHKHLYTVQVWRELGSKLDKESWFSFVPKVR